MGLRAGEVAGMQLDDIDWRRGEITVRGKGSRCDRLPLPVDVGHTVAGYLRRLPSAVQYGGGGVNAGAAGGYARLGMGSIV